MRFKVLDLENQIKSIEKFAVTSFLDVPSRGKVKVFVEVCSAQQGSFELITPAAINIEQDEQLYSNVHACERLFKSYAQIKGAEHVQMVGEKKLHVLPKRCAVRRVAPPKGERGAFCYSIEFDEVPPAQKTWGTWLYWEQPGKYVSLRDYLLRARFEFQVGNLRVENFYLYVHQPPGFRVDTSICEVSLINAPIVASPVMHPMFEFEVSEDFLVFPIWQDFFYNRKILKNRRGIELKGGEKVNVLFSLVSDAASRKKGIRSYFVGIGIGLSLSLVAEIVSSMISEPFRIAFLVVALGLSLILGYRGWKLVQ